MGVKGEGGGGEGRGARKRRKLLKALFLIGFMHDYETNVL